MTNIQPPDASPRNNPGHRPSEPSTAPTSRAGTPSLAPVRKAVLALRSRAWRLLVLRRIAVLLASAIVVFLAAALMDYFIRPPGWLRAIALLAGIGFAAAYVVRRVLPAARFRPTLAEFAYRLEQSAAHRAGTRPTGALTSALEFEAASAGRTPVALDQLEQNLRETVIAEASARFSPAGFQPLINPYPARRAAGVGALLAIALAVGSALAPTAASTAGARLLMPWSGAEWPKRAPLSLATNEDPRAADVAVPLRVTTRGDRNDLEVRYRLIAENDAGEMVPGPTVRGALMPQRQGERTERLHERLVEPASLATGDLDLTATDRRLELEYWFVSQDDRTEPRRVPLVSPPAIASIALSVTRPAYAQGLETGFVEGTLDLGRGLDERAAVGPVLAGSIVRLEARYTKPVADADAWIAPLERSLGVAAGSTDRTVTPRGVVIEGVLTEGVDLRAEVTDEYGIPNREPASIAIIVIPDTRPTVAVTDPPQDEGVLATAVVGLTAEASDDVGVSAVSLEAAIARPDPASGAGAAGGAMDTTAPTTLASRTPRPATMTAGATHSLDLATIAAHLGLATPLAPGDEVILHALATDVFAQPSGEAREPTRSEPRRLVIISESELVDEIRSELNAVRRAARSLDERQADLERGTTEPSEAAALGRGQESLTQRLRGQERRVERLASRLERNRLDDESLIGLLEDANTLAQSAANASERASSALDELARPGDDGETGETGESGEPEADPQNRADTPATPPEDAGEPDPAQTAEDAQRQVRDDLGRLLELLDRGEDGWLARRSVERLLEEQRRLADETTDAGAGTVGRDASELTARELSELERIAERQRRLAEEAERALDELDDRAGQLAEADPTQSDAMSTAARRARENSLAQRLQEAAEAIGNNQTGQASRSQSQAIEALEEILNELDNAQKRRAEELRRQLADLVAAIEALIAQQEREIDALNEVTSAAFDRARLEGLSQRLIRVAQNTASARERARTELDAAPSVLEPMNDALEAQGFAIERFRDRSISDEDAARDAGTLQNRSLSALREALAEAERLLEQAEQESQQDAVRELVKGYREALEEQVSLSADTDPFVGQDLARRDRATVRGLGGRQRSVGERTAALGDQATELGRLGMIEFTAQLLAEAIDGAAGSLERGVADRSVADDQETAVSLIQSLVLALDPPQPDRDPFSDGGAQGGQGQSGSGGQQSPSLDLAELMLLRAVQAQTASLTRRADDRAQGGEPTDTAAAARLRQLQRQLTERAVQMLEKLDQPPEPRGTPAESSPDGAREVPPESDPSGSSSGRPFGPADEQTDTPERGEPSEGASP